MLTLTDPEFLSSLAAVRESGLPVNDNIHLRLPQESDASAFVAAARDELIMDWTELPQPYTLELARDFIEHRVPEELAAGVGVYFSIVRDEEVLGVIGLHTIDPYRTAGVGYWLAPAGRGQGVAAASLRTLSAWSFDNLGLQRLWWKSLIGNIPSLYSAVAAGFQPEGTLRSALGFRGALEDCWAASLLPHDIRLMGSPRTECASEISFGPWVATPVTSDEAIAAERSLPVSACLYDGLWAIRGLMDDTVCAYVGLLVTNEVAWVMSIPTHRDHESASQEARAGIQDFATRELGLNTP